MNDAQIGREVGISRERVRQILLKAGPDKRVEVFAKMLVADAQSMAKTISLEEVTETIKKSIASRR
jgi:hypothetical protein